MSAIQQPDPTIARTPEPGSPPQGKSTAKVSRHMMGFIEGTRPHFSDETAVLLRSRLQAATFVLSILLALAFLGNLFSEYAPLVGIRALVVAAFIGGFFALR